MSSTRSPEEPRDRQRSRLEDEVNEILQKNNRPISFTDHVRRKAAERRYAPRRQRSLSLGNSRFAPVAPFVGAFAVAFLGLALRDTSPLLANVLALLSVALLFLPFVARARGGTNSSVKRWRGREIDLGQSRDGWTKSIRDRFTKGPRL